MPIVAKLLTLSVTTGLLTGVAISFYVWLSLIGADLLYPGDPLSDRTLLSVLYLYAIPTIAIFFVNHLIEKEPGVREYGVTEIAQAVSGDSRLISLKSLFLKIVASVVSLSSGFAVGNEGPSAAIGAMIAYQLNHLFHIPERFVRLILSIGASSGIAAVFVSPLTGIVFAVENIAYEFVQRLIGPIVLAAVVAFTIAYQFLDPLIFRYSVGRVFQLDYLLAALLFVPVILVFLFIYFGLRNHLLHALDRLVTTKFPRWRNVVFALIGGMTIGTLLNFVPHAAFSGHEVTAALINEKLDISVALLALIVLLRILATSVSLYANAVGGLFLPLMSIGALVGYGYAEVMQGFGWHIQAYSFAAIGAAVFMGVVMRLPMTAMVLALEITYDYNVVVPTGITVILASYVANLNFNIRKLKATDIRLDIGEKECEYLKSTSRKSGD